MAVNTTTPITGPFRRSRALGALCAILRRSQQDGQVELTPVGWTDVIAVADELKVLPALYRAVHETGLVPPPGPATLLRRQHTANVARNLALSHGLHAAIAILGEAGITPLLFKGSLSLVDGSVSDIGWRWMADLDMVVPESMLAESVARLQSIGFTALPRAYAWSHEIAVIHPEMPGAIELHVGIGEKTAASVLPIKEVIAASVPVTLADGTVRAPSPTHQVLHCILHSAASDRNHTVGGLPLRQLLTLVDLIEFHGASIDWVEIDDRSAGHGLSSLVHAHLWLAHRLLGLPLTQHQWASVRSRVHEQRVRANFAAGWPAWLHRNLIDALRREHLEDLYAHGDRPLGMAWAGTRHLLGRLRQYSWAENRNEATRHRD
jgi:hypothetical protein